MSGWNGAKVGLKVNGGDKELAKQFLNILGANTEGCRFDEEIGKLDADFAPEITGIIGDRDSDPFDILRGLNDHADSYTEQYVSGSKVKAFTLLDGIYVVLQKILPGSYLYVAHETGNSVCDDYYRYEVIYNPSNPKKKEIHCYYSYGNGINVDTDDQIEEGTEKEDKKISDKLKSRMVQEMIDTAQANGFSELASRLVACK